MEAFLFPLLNGYFRYLEFLETIEGVRAIKNVVYPAIIERSCSGYSVFFPDLPGIASSGFTIEEAQITAAEALAGHLAVSAENGDALAGPSELASIVADPRIDEVARVLVRAA